MERDENDDVWDSFTKEDKAVAVKENNLFGSKSKAKPKPSATVEFAQIRVGANQPTEKKPKFTAGEEESSIPFQSKRTQQQKADDFQDYYLRGLGPAVQKSNRIDDSNKHSLDLDDEPVESNRGGGGGSLIERTVGQGLPKERGGGSLIGRSIQQALKNEKPKKIEGYDFNGNSQRNMVRPSEDSDGSGVHTVASDPVVCSTTATMKWSREQAAQRDSEQDFEENPWTFSFSQGGITPVAQPLPGQQSASTEAVSGVDGKVVFREYDHTYWVKDKEKDEYVRVMVSASALWKYYNENAKYSTGIHHGGTYVNNIESKLPRSILVYLCNFYSRAMELPKSERTLLTYPDRILFYTQVLKQMGGMTKKNGQLFEWKDTAYVLPFPLVAAGVWDLFECWLTQDLEQSMKNEPVVLEKTLDDGPLQEVFLFLSNWFWRGEQQEFREVLKEECPPLFKLLEVKRQALILLEATVMNQKSDKEDGGLRGTDNYSLAKKFAGLALRAGTAMHSYLELRIKNGGKEVDYEDLLLGKEIKRSANDFLIKIIIRGVLGTYRPDLSEVAFVMLKYMIGMKSDCIFQLNQKEFAVADFKASQPCIDDALRFGKVITREGMDWVVLKDLVIPKSSEIWKYTFQLSVYRKGMIMNKISPFSSIGYLFLFSPTYPKGFLIVEIHLDTIRTSLELKGQTFTAPEHLDKALQFRLEWLEKMQRAHKETGRLIDEVSFVQSGGQMEELL